jgi:hypothetical protein
VKSPTHVLCNCGACTEIDRDLDLMDCASCGSTAVDPVCIVACPVMNKVALTWHCSLPFHDYARDAHVVPWEQREMLTMVGE